VGAVACVALVAVAVAGIVITGRLAAGRGPTGLVMAYPPARLADGQFAGPGGADAQQVLPSLTGVGYTATVDRQHPVLWQARIR
jgi:hypothetical protein